MIEWLHNAMHPFDLDGLVPLLIEIGGVLGLRLSGSSDDEPEPEP